MRPVLLAVVALSTALLSASPAPSPAPPSAASSISVVQADDAAVVVYRPPVRAPQARGFDAPTSPYGPGNRGIEYATDVGAAVVAAADGIVTFAGPVAGERYVTVGHADRVRTTYGRLDGIEVVVGQRLAAGEQVGTAGTELIWTARIGRAYVDPAILLAASGAAGSPSVRLVPTSGAEQRG